MLPRSSLCGVEMWESGRREIKPAHGILFVLCVLFRLRLTAGALVYDHLDACAFNKLAGVVFAWGQKSRKQRWFTTQLKTVVLCLSCLVWFHCHKLTVFIPPRSTDCIQWPLTLYTDYSHVRMWVRSHTAGLEKNGSLPVVLAPTGLRRSSFFFLFFLLNNSSLHDGNKMAVIFHSNWHWIGI